MARSGYFVPKALTCWITTKSMCAHLFAFLVLSKNRHILIQPHRMQHWLTRFVLSLLVRASIALLTLLSATSVSVIFLKGSIENLTVIFRDMEQPWVLLHISSRRAD